ncbi:MAG: ATP-binding protein [Rhizomicrobium sp.]
MAEMVRHSVGDRIRIDWRLNARWKTVCDANQMESAILNLAINARDAMPDGGTLTIETSDVRVEDTAGYGADVAPGDHVELRIGDTGTGMSDEVRKRALDPFFTTKPLGQGTGLGLSMAFGFIRQSSGTLRIESAPGRGTTIVILLARQTGDENKEAA